MASFTTDNGDSLEVSIGDDGLIFTITKRNACGGCQPHSIEVPCSDAERIANEVLKKSNRRPLPELYYND